MTKKLILPMIYIHSDIGSQLYSDLVAGWEFGANSGNIGVELKGIANGTPTDVTKISSDSGIDNLALSSNNGSSLDMGRVEIPYHSSLSVVGQDFTFATLYNSISIRTEEAFHFYSKHAYLNNERTIDFYRVRHSMDGNVVRFLTGNNSNQFDILLSSITIADGIWYLIIAEYNYLTNTKKIFVNNIERGSQNPSIAITENTSNNAYILGSYSGSFYENQSHNGLIQYVYRWNRLLSQSEKDYLWNNGNFTYLPKP